MNNPEIPDDEKQELSLEYTDLFNDTIEHYEGIIQRGRGSREFYYDDSDSEAEYPYCIHSFY